jgi:hypothetical protein
LLLLAGGAEQRRYNVPIAIVGDVTSGDNNDDDDQKTTASRAHVATVCRHVSLYVCCDSSAQWLMKSDG